MTGVIYARYSSDNQREESIEGQIRENTAFAEKNGITIVGHYIDRAVSAKINNRLFFNKRVRISRHLLHQTQGSTTEVVLLFFPCVWGLVHSSNLRAYNRKFPLLLCADFAYVRLQNCYRAHGFETLRRVVSLCETTSFSLMIGFYGEPRSAF